MSVLVTYALFTITPPSTAGIATLLPSRVLAESSFTASRAVLEKAAKLLMEQIDRDGTVWISWPKKASKVPTDITEDVIRDVVLPIGLVDVKVAAVNEIWSGLKLVIRKELR